jgi:hypothetical protein
MGDRKSSGIRLSFFCNDVHFPVCERPRPPAASAETTNKAAGPRNTNFIRAFILETFYPFQHKSHVLHDPAILKMVEAVSCEKCHFEAESIALVLPLAWRARAEGRKACCCRSSRAKASWALWTGPPKD